MSMSSKSSRSITSGWIILQDAMRIQYSVPTGKKKGTYRHDGSLELTGGDELSFISDRYL